jgi:hypothetical protein
MTPVRPAAVTATLNVTPASWGTKVSLDCRWVGPTTGAGSGVKKTYRPGRGAPDGGDQQVLAQWAVVPGEDAKVAGSTDLAASGIAAIELQAVADDAVLLQSKPAPTPGRSQETRDARRAGRTSATGSPLSCADQLATPAGPCTPRTRTRPCWWRWRSQSTR